MNKEIDKDLLVDLIKLYFTLDINITVKEFINIVDSIYVYLKKLGDKE